MTPGSGGPPGSDEEKPKKRRPRRKKRREPTPASTAPGAAKPKPLGPWLVALAVVVAVLFVLSVILAYPASHGPGPGRDVELDVPGDESPEALADRLAAAGLVKWPRLFAAYVNVTGAASRVARGPHLLTDDLSPREIALRLERSPWAARARVTFPEGWTRFDMAKRLQQNHVCTARAFLDATNDAALLHDLRIEGQPSAEGFLFPATYDLPCDADARDVVRRMKTEFDKRWSIASQRHGSSLNDVEASLHWGMREIVTLASMVEKEAVADDERPLIASVFVNRLRDPSFTPKLLQCDPTAAYGCLVMGAQIPSCASFTGKITHDVVQDAANPYSTYKHEGLPPTPIANPGTKSLEAAMAPAPSRYLYFVAKGDGHSTFSETYGAHTSAIRANAPKP
jgi:UPF0755 protein